MASLKDLRGRIGSVKQTQKITSAMKLVAASKLGKRPDVLVSLRDPHFQLEVLNRWWGPVFSPVLDEDARDVAQDAYLRAYRNIERQGNPWGIASGNRMDWAEGLDVPGEAELEVHVAVGRG